VEYVMVQSSEELAELCERARSAGRIGLDTEFLWERTYSPQICLAQLNVEDRVYLADPLEGVDLAPIASLISDPDVQVVMHAPHADLVAFAQRFDADPVNTFDTQLAAGFTGLSAGLAYEKLVHEVTRRRVQPSESFTDWSRRPLGEKQLRYAGEDVEHLFAMCDRITERLRERGRESWMREELARRFDGADRFVTPPLDAWRKVGRRGKLGAGDLAVLREVAAWRERLARLRDLPVGWIAKDPTLIEIARRKPRSAKDLQRVRGVDSSMKQRELQELLEAIERGRDAEPIREESPPPIRGVRRRTAIAKGLATALLRARCEGEEIASELVGTSSDVEELITWISAGQPEDAARPFLLRGWREPFGLDLVDLVEGRIQLQLGDTEPYLMIHRDAGS
jgi:ribonuclease D